MQAIAYPITAIIMGILIYGLNTYMTKERAKAREAKQVHLPKSYFWIGIAVMTLFAGLPLISLILPDFFTGWSLWVGAGFIFFMLLGFLIIIAYINCRIDILDNTFIYGTFFGKRYEFKYTDIVRFRQGRSTTHIYTKNKHLYLDNYAVGDDAFLLKYDENMQKMYREQRK